MKRYIRMDLDVVSFLFQTAGNGSPVLGCPGPGMCGGSILPSGTAQLLSQFSCGDQPLRMYILSCYSPWDSESLFYKNVTQVMKIQHMSVQKSFKSSPDERV